MPKQKKELIEDALRSVAPGIDAVMKAASGGERFGFFLVVFPKSMGMSDIESISNVRRQDVIKILKMQLEYWEQNPSLIELAPQFH